MTEITKEQQKVFDVANEIGGKVRESYSGRGMFGDTCMGIVCEDANECMKVAGRKKIKATAKTDSMGLSVIVYWESIPAIEDDEEEDN